MPTTKIQRFLPSHYLNVLGKNLPALYDALNDNIEKTEILIQSCIDQLFLSTADGRYLIQLGEEQGFTMPSNSGLDIRSYKLLVPVMSAAPKQVRLSIEDLVEVFYTPEKIRASIISGKEGPYSLSNGDNLIIRTESGIEDISIISTQVSDITSVSASEIAAILNISQNLYIASPEINKSTGAESLKLISKTRGSGSYIQVIGGTIQNVLQFPKVADTKNTIGTTWNVSKEETYSDRLTFTWDGAGVNPNLYLISSGDYVTIRGLVDNSHNFSDINGSYEIIDSGYDYFVIYNDKFNVISASYTEINQDELFFTKNEKNTLFDKDEYAIVSEIKNQTITVTVPAIPPLARRFLKGSAHLHGNEYDVVDFTRNNIKINILSNDEKASIPNYFLLSNVNQRYNFIKKQYKVLSTDIITEGVSTYVVDASDQEYAALPYTTPTFVKENPIFASIGSSKYVLSFNFLHGLEYSWGFTLDNVIPQSNLSSADLNKEHIVNSVLNNKEVEFVIYDTNGDPVVFDGIAFSSGNVFRHSLAQADGSDFYIEFGTPTQAINSGLKPGITFKFNDTGTNVDLYLSNLLKNRVLTVKSISGSKVNFSAGLGFGPNGIIMTGVDGKRSGYIGGNSVTYYLDKNSSINQDRIFNGLRVLFTGYTKSQNENYVGSYIYDPKGVKTNLNISKYLVNLKTQIQKGQSLISIFTETPESGFPNSGDLVINYGKTNIEGPIPYRSIVTNLGVTQFLIDPSYKFKYSHLVGSKVQYVNAKSQYVPTLDGKDYPVYITGTASARNTMFQLIKLLTASGIFIESDVKLPELRYSDESINPFV